MTRGGQVCQQSAVERSPGSLPGGFQARRLHIRPGHRDVQGESAVRVGRPAWSAGSLPRAGPPATWTRAGLAADLRPPEGGTPDLERWLLQQWSGRYWVVRTGAVGVPPRARLPSRLALCYPSARAAKLKSRLFLIWKRRRIGLSMGKRSFACQRTRWRTLSVAKGVHCAFS